MIHHPSWQFQELWFLRSSCFITHGTSWNTSTRCMDRWRWVNSQCQEVVDRVQKAMLKGPNNSHGTWIGKPVGLIKATTHLSQQLVKLQEDQLCHVWTCCTFGQMTWQDQWLEHQDDIDIEYFPYEILQTCQGILSVKWHHGDSWPGSYLNLLVGGVSRYG